MNEVMTLELPEELARRARALARATNRRLEDAIVDWIGRAVDEPDLGAISDEQVLSFCDARMIDEEQEQLSRLLEKQREREIEPAEHKQLEQLLDAYRRGLLIKARALKEAVARGLRPRLDDHAA